MKDHVRLDGPDYNYTANMCEFATVHNLLFTPTQDPRKLSRKHGKDNTAEIIASCDIAVAYSKTGMFSPNEPRRYLKVEAAELVQGTNEPCTYHHKTRRLHQLTYLDDILAQGLRQMCNGSSSSSASGSA